MISIKRQKTKVDFLPFYYTTNEKGCGQKMEKKLTYREDGFLEIQLDEAMVFDDYLYSLIQEDPHCLTCIRDHRRAHHYYFDLHGLQTLKEYLSCHPMLDLLSFSIRLFTTLWKVGCRKQIMFDCDELYVGNQGFYLYVLCLPVGIPLKDDAYLVFVKQLCDLMIDVKDYETFGLIYASALKNESLKETLDQLLALEKKRYLALPFWKRWKYKQRQEKEEEIIPQRSRMLLPSELNENETQVLCMNHQSYFECMETKERFYLKEDMIKIGRAQDNHWIIAVPSISSYHACFVASQRKVMDLGSLNGTYVNDVKIEECLLQEGDRVRFAMNTFIYHE